MGCGWNEKTEQETGGGWEQWGFTVEYDHWLCGDTGPINWSSNVMGILYQWTKSE